MPTSWCEGRTAYASPYLGSAHLDAAALAPAADPLTVRAPADSAIVAAEPVLPDPQPEPADRQPETDRQPRTKPRPWLVRHWQLPVAVVMLVIAYFTLRSHLPSVHSIGQAITSANVRWILIAAAFETISLGMFARQQRSLLGAVGVRMSIPRALALTYARSALAISMPAGSAVSAGFAFQQYRRSGASNDKAAAVMVLSGVMSFLGLGALYVAGVLGLLAVEPTETIRNHPTLVYTLGGVLVIGVVAWLIRRRATAGRTPSRAPVLQTGNARLLVRVRTTVRQSIDISSEGIPSMAILAPWLMLASMSRKPAGLPDISRPTSKPSVMPSCFWTSASCRSRTFTASVTPSFRASSSR